MSTKTVARLKISAVLLLAVMLQVSCSKNFSGPGPTIESVTPARGWTGVANTITISGSGFAPMVRNTLSGSVSVSLPIVALLTPTALTLTVTFAGTTEIHAVVPAGAPAGGPYGIKVTNPNGNSAILAAAYTVTLTPLITVSSIYPNFGWTQTATTVYISGEGFTSTPAASLISPTTGIGYPLDNVAFINLQSLSAVVPSGLPVGGPYSVTVINPDGDAGLLANAFTVTQNPPPYVDNVNPGQGTTSQDLPVTISGKNFRAVSVVLIDSNYQPLACAISVTSFTTTSISATLPVTTCGIAAGMYLVRVIDTDEYSYYDWSAFVVTNPAGNPGSWQTSPATSWLTKGRVGLGVTSGHDDLRRIYLYAVGGAGTFTPPTTASSIFNDSEVVQLDPFGRLGSWMAIPNIMTNKRFGLAAVQFSGWVYAVGGTADGTNPVSSCPVEKAKILTSDTAPQNLRATSAGYGSLGGGTWYYRVSAVMTGSNPENPNGEGLSSDERTVTIGGGSAVGLMWSPPVRYRDDVAYYRVYRSDYANGASSTEHLIADNVTPATYTDTGRPAGTAPFLPNGSLAVFTCETSAGFTPRYGLSSVVEHDPGGAMYIYALGGSKAGGTPTGVVEYSLINPTSGSLGTWATTTASITPRYFLASVFADSSNAPVVGSNNYIYAVGGTPDGNTSLGNVQLGSVFAGGDITSWPSETNLSPSNMGMACVAVDNWIFDIDGWQGGGPGKTVDSIQIKTSSGNLGPPGWNSAGNGGTTIWSRFLGGTTLESAFIYNIGGFGSCQSPQCSMPTSNTALQTVEEVIW